MAKMVKCKTCGAEIAKSANVCPSCGAKQHQGAKVACVLIIILAIFAIIGIIAGSGEEPHTVDNNNPPASWNDQASQTTEDSTPEKTAFGVGDKVELNDVVVTLVDVSENNGGNYMTPSDGKVFVVCEFEIENNSDRDIAVSSIMSFEAYVDGYSTNMNLSAMLSTDKTQLDGSVAAGKKMNGVIGYEVDQDWTEIEIRFTPDFWSQKDITFTYSK